MKTNVGLNIVRCAAAVYIMTDSLLHVSSCGFSLYYKKDNVDTYEGVPNFRGVNVSFPSGLFDNSSNTSVVGLSIFVYVFSRPYVSLLRKLGAMKGGITHILRLFTC